MKRLLIASNNQGKIEEIRNLFSDLGYHVYSMKEFGTSIQVIEDQPDFAGNSLKKAREVSKAVGETVLADDSGLEVAALGGQPGVHSARFAGEEADDRENNEKLLYLMQNVPEAKRKARFRCVLTMYWPDGHYIQTEGTCSGKIGYSLTGEGGFGYDPLFTPEGFTKTMAELTLDEKNRISHRAIAIKVLIDKLVSGN